MAFNTKTLLWVVLWALCLTVRAQRSRNSDNDCISVPSGDYLFNFWQQTEADNDTLLLQFRSILYLEETMPDVITGLGAGVFSHNAPVPRELIMVPVPTQVVGTRDPETCVIATTFFGTDPPFNDIIVMTYDGEMLRGRYVTMINGTLTTTVHSLGEGTLLPDD